MGAASFLSRLRDGSRIDTPVLVVVAHPDDETVGCGAVLSRLDNVRVVVATDGARGTKEANVGDAEYIAERHAELLAAVALAGLAPANVTCLGLSDQRAALNLVLLTQLVQPLLREAEIILTHAFEGGHPDHDAVAFAVHAAVALAEPAVPAAQIIEMPLYRAAAGDWVLQRFVASQESETIVSLSPEERQLRRGMMAAHRTQRGLVRHFSIEVERFRVAPKFRFTMLPNNGDVLYERFVWGMTGERWQELVADALRDLSLTEAL